MIMTARATSRIYRRRLRVNRFNLLHVAHRDDVRHDVPALDPDRAVRQGHRRTRPSIFLQTTPPPGSAGGLANAIVGSVLIVGVATLVATPIGILAGIYLAEYGRNGWIARLTRFMNDILLSAPSIVLGLFVYTIYVMDVGHFSGWAGSAAFGLIAIPVVVRTTENMLQLVPASLREAAVALGAPMYKVILTVTLRAVRGGVITGILLAVARMSGETAPLLFTSLNNQFWQSRHERADGEPAGRHLPVRAEPVRRLEGSRVGRRVPDHDRPCSSSTSWPGPCSANPPFADTDSFNASPAMDTALAAAPPPAEAAPPSRRANRRCRSAISTSSTAASRD